MATDVETLLVQLRADARPYEKAMAQAVASSEANTRRIERQFATTNKNVAAALAEMRGNVSRGLGPLPSGLLGGLAGGVVAKEITGLADKWQEATNKIKATGLGDLDAKVAMDAIAGIADRARTDFASTADLYARMSRAGQGFGATQAQVAVATEVVAKSLKITGASAQETESTLIQLGQALTSGRLQGDELRSLSENAPVVAKAIADAFGVSVGQLKDLGAEGKLTSDRVFKAIIDAQPAVEKAFAATTGTVADGFKKIETAAIKFVGTSSTTNGAMAALAAALNGVATNFDTVATGALALGALLASRLAAAGLAPVVAAFGATVASASAANVALGAAGSTAARSTGAFAAAAIAARGLGAGLLTIAGGPVGLLIFGLVSILGVFAGKAAEGANASKIYAAALAEIEAKSTAATPAVAALGSAVEQTSRRMNETKIAEKTADLSRFGEGARDLESQLRGMVAGIEQFGAARVSNGEKEAALAAIKAGMEGDAQAALTAKARIEELGAVNPSFAAAFAQFGAVLQALANIRAQAGAARAAIAGVNAAQSEADTNAKARDDQAALFKAGAPAISAPDPSRTLAKLAADRRVILAEMDETKRKIAEKTDEIYKENLKAGGGLTITDAEAAARKIVAAEDAGGGGSKKAGGAAEENPLDKILTAHQRRVEALQREKAALGQTTLEAAKAEEAHRLLDAAKDAEIPITDALKARIDTLAEAYARTKVQVDEARAAQQAFKDIQQFVGQSLSSFFSDIVSGGKNASEALMNLAKRLADAAFQAALLGSGPLAGLFGAKGDNGGVGGIIGMLFKGFSGFGGAATGSVGAPMSIIPQLAVGTSNVPQDMLARIHQGEIVMPKYDADLLRSGKIGGDGTSYVSIAVDVRGAQGNTEVRQMVEIGVAQGMAAMQRNLDRNAHTIFHQAETRFG